MDIADNQSDRLGSIGPVPHRIVRECIFADDNIRYPDDYYQDAKSHVLSELRGPNRGPGDVPLLYYTFNFFDTIVRFLILETGRPK